MNCSLCKYRAQVLGFEREVGAPQHSHHHHVEGLVESCTLCERECTGACQPDGVPLPVGGSAGGHDHAHGPGQGDTITIPPIPMPTIPWARSPCAAPPSEPPRQGPLALPVSSLDWTRETWL